VRSALKLQNTSLFVLLISISLCAQAGEATVALGIYNFEVDGFDIGASYRTDQSHWQYAYRYVTYTYTGTGLFGGNYTETDTVSGPVINYLFLNESRHTPYIGVGLFNWKQNYSSRTDYYLGGGYMGKMVEHGYFNLGLYGFGDPGTSSGEWNADLQLQLGFFW